MSLRIVLVMSLLALAACSTARPSSAISWADCAKTKASALVAHGVQSSWPRVAELPSGDNLQPIDLGQDPPDATADFFMNTLYLSRRANAFYLERTGGIAGIHYVYGPVSLRGYCRAPSPSAP